MTREKRANSAPTALPMRPAPLAVAHVKVARLARLVGERLLVGAFAADDAVGEHTVNGTIAVAERLVAHGTRPRLAAARETEPPQRFFKVPTAALVCI